MNIQLDRNHEIPQGFINMERQVYLYGIGSYADHMLEILNRYNIVIKGILVSKDYMETNTYRGIPVQIYDENNAEDYIIVAGFNVLFHKELMDRLIYANNVKKIYVLNGVDIFFENDFNFLHSKVCLIDNYYKFMEKRALTYSYYSKNASSFNQTYNWLDDEMSRETMEAYIRGNIELGNFPMRSFWKRQDWDDQYFAEDLIDLSDHEIVIDCGAYMGETFIAFQNRVKTFEKYYAFEPNKRAFERLRKTLKEVGERGLHIPLGAWKEKAVLPFGVEMNCGMIVDDVTNNEYIECDAIDHIVSINEKVTFIKMDIEGAELNALIGAANIIKQHRPKLAISVYHKKEDLITIPQYIKSLSAEAYKLYLRAHMPYTGELILYGIPV